MRTKIAVGVLAFSSLLVASSALAQTASTTPAFKPMPVTFPIDELGGCSSKDECKAYCDDTAHKDACFTYAQAHGLMTRDQVATAKKLEAQVGPGGCKGDECKNYCQDASHAQVCLEFAQQNGFIAKDIAAKRLMQLKEASSSRATPPIPVNATGTISTSTPPKRPLNFNASTTQKIGSTTRPQGAAPRGQLTTPPPPKPNTEQGSSVWYAILHFFWR